MTEMLSNGVELMIVGMGIVFLFLTMLVIAVNIMSKFVVRFLPATSNNSVSNQTIKNSGNIDPKLIAAISSAVHQYRNKK